MKKLLSTLFLMLAGILMLAGCGGSGFSESKNISVVAREDGSGTKSAFMEIVGLKGKTDISGIIIGTGTAGILAEVKGNPHAIAYESLGYVTSDVKKLKVDGVEATTENIKNGTYKIARPLNVLYKSATITSGANKEFYDFLNSTNAQTIIAAEGYVATKEGATAYTMPANAAALTGEVKISGSTSLQPLMIVLAREFEKIHTSVDVTVSGGGSGTGYTNAENGTSNFGMISENFNETKAPNCIKYEVAKDGIAMIVNNSNTFNNITLAQIKSIYNVEATGEEKILTWSALK